MDITSWEWIRIQDQLRPEDYGAIHIVIDNEQLINGIGGSARHFTWAIKPSNEPSASTIKRTTSFLLRLTQHNVKEEWHQSTTKVAAIATAYFGLLLPLIKRWQLEALGRHKAQAIRRDTKWSLKITSQYVLNLGWYEGWAIWPQHHINWTFYINYD